MKKHLLPLIVLAGACAVGITFIEIVDAQEPAAPASASDIVSVASSDADFSTLVSALEDLLKPENKKMLTKLLKNHVIDAVVMAD